MKYSENYDFVPRTHIRVWDRWLTLSSNLLALAPCLFISSVVFDIINVTGIWVTIGYLMFWGTFVLPIIALIIKSTVKQKFKTSQAILDSWEENDIKLFEKWVSDEFEPWVDSIFPFSLSYIQKLDLALLGFARNVVPVCFNACNFTDYSLKENKKTLELSITKNEFRTGKIIRRVFFKTFNTNETLVIAEMNKVNEEALLNQLLLNSEEETTKPAETV